MPTLEERVTVLEERMDQEAGLRASQDRDLADVKEILRTHGRLIKAIADTQSQHTETLKKHSETLDKHTDMLNKHTEMLNKHTEILSYHSKLLGGLTATMDRVVGDLDDQEKTLTRLRVIQEEHGERLDRLDSGLHVIIGKLDTLIGRDGR